MAIENRSATVFRDWRRWERLTRKQHRRILEGGRTVLQLDCGTRLHDCQKCMLKRVNFTLCKLYLNS